MRDNPSPETASKVDQRDELRCTVCGITLYGRPASRHHRRRRSQSPKSEVHNVENLIDVCGTGTTGCHGMIHAHPAKSYANGWLVHSWDDPKDVPVHTWHGWVLLTPDGGIQGVQVETNEEGELEWK